MLEIYGKIRRFLAANGFSTEGSTSQQQQEERAHPEGIGMGRELGPCERAARRDYRWPGAPVPDEPT